MFTSDRLSQKYLLSRKSKIYTSSGFEVLVSGSQLWAFLLGITVEQLNTLDGDGIEPVEQETTEEEWLQIATNLNITVEQAKKLLGG